MLLKICKKNIRRIYILHKRGTIRKTDRLGTLKEAHIVNIFHKKYLLIKHIYMHIYI